MKEIEVLYVGDNEEAVTVSQSGYDFFFRTHLVAENWLEDALEKDPVFSVKRLWGTAVESDFPNSLEDLRKYHVIILSDIGSDTIRLYSDISKGRRGADRAKLIRDFVQTGGGLLMCGGYLSFAGYHNAARYHDTAVEEALPVMIKDGDDRVEVPDGCTPSFSDQEHPVTKGIDWTNPEFYFLGYNRLKAKSNSKVLASYGDDPIVIVWEYGSGRSMAFASDCNPHWAGTFVNWVGYARFWQQSVKWLARQT